MFQIEIYEYTPKMSDLYHHFYNNIETRNSHNHNHSPNLLDNNINQSNHHFEDSLENKIMKIKTLNHPLIFKYLDFVKEDNNYIFVSENSGDHLEDILDVKLSENVSFTQDEVIKILYQLFIAVNYLEKKGINLRFLDTKRICLIEENRIKLKNYIVDILFKPEEMKFINNFKYTSPELIFYPESNHNCKSVIWSIGVIALELLINIRKFSSHQKLFTYFSTNDFLKDYVEILLKYKDTSIFLKSEKNVEFDSSDPRLLLEYFFNGHFINKEELSEDFKDFLCSLLQIDPDKRKDSSYFIHHPIFKDIRKSVLEKINNSKLTLLPVEKEYLQNLTDDIKFKIASSEDNYEIFKEILKVDVVAFLKKKGVLNYKPKILDIPQYFSLYSPECEDYSISSEDDNTFSVASLKTKKQERRNSVELLYENDLNERKFNEGCIVLIGNYLINLPTDYEKDTIVLENFIKNSIYDLQLYKSEGFSLLSDKSSNSDQSKFSVRDGSSTNITNSNSLTNLNFTKSTSKIFNQNFEKEIYHYFRMKYLISNILFQKNNYKKEDLIVELKKMNYHIPSNFRKFVYLIILEIDYFNDLEELESSSIYENRDFLNQEITQIKKDISRCEEYDNYYKSDEGKFNLHYLFEGLLYNKEDFFYVQGMDSIAAALIKLYYPNKEYSYQVFYKFFKKLLFNFYDFENKTIKNLNFHHLIIQRLISFIEPELFLHLENIGFFEENFAANWILTLFSRTFKFDILFKIWDVLIIENISIIYIFITHIFKENKNYILSNSKETIIKDLNEISDYMKIESFINDVIKYYKIIPHCIIPISYEFNEGIMAELKNNEYFKNRWWDFENFHVEEYKVPILTLEDTIKIFDRVLFVDIRIQMEYENLRIRDSLHLSLSKNKYYENCMNILQKNNGIKIVVLIGNKSSRYSDYINFLLNKKIKFVSILQGGIDVVYIDEISLIYKK